MARVLSVAAERFPIAGTFTISRGSKTEAEVIACTISDGGRSGRGECVPYRRYGETHGGRARRDRGDARRRSRPASSRDCLLDAHAGRAPRATPSTARCGTSRRSSPAGRVAEPDLHCRAAAARHRLHAVARHAGGDGGAGARQCRRGRCSRSRSAATATSPASAPSARRRPTAASSSTPMKAGPTPTSRENLAVAAELGVALIEQPLPAGRDAILRRYRASGADLRRRKRARRPTTCAALVGRYDAVNIKLDKAGGLTEALDPARPRARAGLRDHGRLHGRHVAGHGAGRAAGAGRRFRRPRRSAAAGPRPRRRRSIYRRIAGVTARAGALGLSAAASRISTSPTSATPPWRRSRRRRSARRADPTAASPPPWRSRWRRRQMPCAAPVRSSGTVSPIIFCSADQQIAGRQRMQAWTAKKPATPSPSGQISGKAIQRTIAATPADHQHGRRPKPSRKGA